jgi:sulfonate transport system ATP-binding protein
MTGAQVVAPPDEDVSVRVDSVVRRFGDRVVLDGLELEIRGSEFVVLLGPSGCGKSTLLRLLAGLDRPDAGSVAVPRGRAIVFQNPRLLPWQRVWQNVTIGLRGKDARNTALAVLDEVGLQGHARAWPKTLSGGEAQRVAPGHSSPIPRSCCSTSRSRLSTRSPGCGCTAWSGRCGTGTTPRCSS